MADFDISDNLAMRVKLEPTIITPIDINNNMTSYTGIGTDSAVGMKIGLNF